MSYAPNVVSKDDIVEINGVLFKVRHNFNIANGDRILKLERVDKINCYKGIIK